jgi:hypothetical protein
MVRSTQIDSNEIRLDDILKDEEMEVKTAWEDSNLATLKVMEEGATVAPQEGRGGT